MSARKEPGARGAGSPPRKKAKTRHGPQRLRQDSAVAADRDAHRLPLDAGTSTAGKDDPHDLFTYGSMKVPTVVDLLRNILTQYPDNGQIIKELVQNAEDARATCVEVIHFHDPLRQHEAQEMVQRFMKGPGLCLYNDAVFSEEDWEGIRRLSDSIKKNDPLRVGQFGMGFKSVFHLTDYVTIISGKRVLFMDPSASEDKMCRFLTLENLTKVLPDPSSHKAFARYLPTHLEANSNFLGTLFWFPLRQSPSKISNTVYTPDDVSRLFESFSVEADICLTFLKSLEKITLGKAVGGDVNITHSMTITSQDMEEVRHRRLNFKQDLEKGSRSCALSCCYEVTLQATIESKPCQRQTMKILHLLPGQKDEEWIEWMGCDKAKHIPLVGVAVPVSPQAAPRFRGHIFSFLPLPPDPSNQTALPIQVNGAFVLSQNRRQVKWRTDESSNSEHDVHWNEDLVSKVVVRAYLEVLKELLEEAKDSSINADTWYTFLPSLQETTGRWHEMAEQVWRGLQQLPIVATEVCGFLPPCEVLICNDLSPLNPSVASSVKKVLCGEKLPIATLPDHVQEAVKDLELSRVTPELLRKTLRGTNSCLEGQETKQDLLYFAAMDKQHHDLHGLPLLPLEDGSWSTFSEGNSASPVYLCTRREAKALLGQERHMAGTWVAEPAWKVLEDVAESGQTQLCRFIPEQHGPALLTQSAGHVQQCQPSQEQVEQWLCEAWEVLQHLSELSSVKDIPVIPTSQPPSASSLTSLSSPVVVQGRDGQLSEPQVGVLELMGVVVAPSFPEYIRHIDLQGHLFSADCHGTTQALCKVAQDPRVQIEAIERFNIHRNEHQRQMVTSLVETTSIQPSLKNFLIKLSIFKAVDTDKLQQDSCLENVDMIAPELEDFPVCFPETLLMPTSTHEQALALALGARQLTKEDLCIRALKCHSDYSNDNIVALARYILQDPHLFGSDSVVQRLRNTSFVPNIAGALCRPSDLYDPEDRDNCVLLGETQKPADSFSDYFPLLRSLGLKKVQDMPHDDLIHIIEDLKNNKLSENDKARKSVGLLHAVNRRSDCKEVCLAVLGVPFVYGATRPCGYPSNLEWVTPPGPLVPQSLRSLQYSSVLGSTTALVECRDFPLVSSAFGWTEAPAVEPVIQHLKNLAATYQLEERDNYFILVKETYHQLSTALNTSEAAQLANLKTECCVFTEYGFMTPDKVYIKPDNEDLQLLPYLHVLPFELQKKEQLFLHLGCASQQSPPLLLAVLEGVRTRHRDSTSGIGSREVQQDRRLVMSVLDRLQHHLQELQGPLLVPVKTQGDVLELAEVEHTAYTEKATEWLDSEELGVKVVHECVGVSLARALGVAPLQNFLSAGGEDVMEWGQEEPLTTRLHNLLHQYRDGVSIMKELVQNADDAGATTFRLLYDERQNEDARALLLSPGMERWQGPALWAYNDALFSEEDFRNLREVGAGTKELQPTKIGKFGLGFCSVYNLTDVPSFISGSTYVVFDPHMTNLSTAANTPGLRYKLTDRRNSYMLRTLRNQFQPFAGVFDCDLQGHGSFEGTLFRLPFRTTSSKISNTCYSRADMVQLLKMFSGVVGQLLLFTQHVTSIRVFHLDASASAPSEMVELFRSDRSRCLPLPVPSLSSMTSDRPQSVLERGAALFTKQQEGFKWKGKLLAETNKAEVNVQHFQGGADLCGLEEGEWNTTWLTSWHSGTGSASRLAESLGGKALPLAAVTVPVRENRGGWQPLCLTHLPLGFYHDSHVHCFLPLPVKTLLPVQINGLLEVASDRTNLLVKTEDDRHAFSWNITLAEDALMRAYLGLAEALRRLGLCAESPFHDIWPVANPGAGTLVEVLTEGFYRTLEQDDLELLRCSSGDWHPLSRCCFLEQNLLQVPQVGDIAFEFLEKYLCSPSESRLVRLPQHIFDCLSKQVMSKQVISEETFFNKYFVPHMHKGLVSHDKRDQLTLYLLDTEHPCLELLRHLPCIPTQPHGTLRSPADLVQPDRRIARMFYVDDERFPLEKFFSSVGRSSMLASLGMNTDRLPKELVVERAETVSGLNCSECARDRVRELLHYFSELIHTEQDELGNKLQSVPFLPVMPKPEGWPVSWHGESVKERKTHTCLQHPKTMPERMLIDCPTALCLPSFKSLVSSCHLLLDESLKETPHDVLQRLGVVVCALSLPLRSVVEQLCVLSTVPPGKENESMCHAVYDHLEDFISHVRRGKAITSGKVEELGKLKEKKILITKSGFKEPKLFAVFSKVDCAPDLFSARTEGLEKYHQLMDTLGIKKNFDYEIVMDVIQKKYKTVSSSNLSSREVSQMSRLLNVLYKVKRRDQQLTEDLHLPDSKGFLRPTSQLCFDDGASLSSGKFFCLHNNVTVRPDMLSWLGIQSKTRKRLQESSSRLPFGQNEPLTTRLKNILEEYPCDLGIMKELLQNADDAGATEVVFIKDFRKLPQRKLFDDNMASLQGPALSVFNNKGFTEQDLRSIQDLGNSSKKEDPATTGQYGIGFNAVYHLTDAPSFLTKGPQVPGRETLCMFDPHCWYDPAATPEYPGVQFVNLRDLRKDHPDSFIGYLENELPEEGTVFRLPLRTTTESLIVPQKIITEREVTEMLTEFQRGMSQCLLFLRNVRRISIKKVQMEGTCIEEYCVEASVSEEQHLPMLARKYGDNQDAGNPCSVDMERTTYTMNIKDSRGTSSCWLVVQQQGVEEKNSLPALVKDAFRMKALSLLPHGGVAILLEENPSGTETPSTSCYLPLPIVSGLPFSINGHFALNPSRRNLWTGFGDPKSLWNKWLIRELLVPVAAHAVEEFRTLIFPSGDEHMAEHMYLEKVRVFDSVLPLASSANSEEWRIFIKGFYEEVRTKEFAFFYSFTPETDLKPPLRDHVSLVTKMAASEDRRGLLRWHAFCASGNSFPVHFPLDEHNKDYLPLICDVFKRLGMKVSSKEILHRVREADPEFECLFLNPETALTFLRSWSTDTQDSCLPRLDSKVTDTPFLTPVNVLSVMKYITQAKDFSSSCLNNLPLLLTNDGVLRCFSTQSPVFLSIFCDLLPASGKEFISHDLVEEVEKDISNFQDVVKGFTPADFGQRLSNEPDASDYWTISKAPLMPHKLQWLKSFWSFVVHYLEEMFKSSHTFNRGQGKEYIQSYLGDWTLYPVKKGDEEFLIPIKDSWQALHVCHYDRGAPFLKLPVPFSVCEHLRGHSSQQSKSDIYCQWKFDANLTDPISVLELLYFHRESINNYFKEKVRSTEAILEYLGENCHKYSFPESRNKIRSLQIFCDVSGEHCHLEGMTVIVLEDSFLHLERLTRLCEDSSLFMTKKSTPNITNLYSYIEPNCMVKEVDLYARFILPKITTLTEEDRTFYLDKLGGKLAAQRGLWREREELIVSALKSCSFIEDDGEMRTADNFFDPLNPVFNVMGVANLPEPWREEKWRHLLQLAGMIQKVTPEKFLEFTTLSAEDKHVKQKCEVLCRYLGDHFEDFCSVLPQILDKEFLVPEKHDELESLLPHHKTKSGLLAFSGSANPDRGLAQVVWSTRSLLPEYAIRVAKMLQREYSSKMRMDDPPVEDIIEHVEKLCCSLQKEPEKLPTVVEKVMEEIYTFLSEGKDNIIEALKQRDIPVIHIQSHRVFVPTSQVVESLEEEILPYLYKAPNYYGKFFSTLKKLGMQEQASADSYAQVLKNIQRNSGQERLHPEEAKRMKLAMKGLVKHPYKLKDLSISELFLPSEDETLRSSVKMFVADNEELFLTIRDTFQELIFVGFKSLDISFQESSFVKLLPPRLQPKFLSEAVQEILVHEGMEYEASDFLREVQELLQVEEFKTGVLRIINHHKLGQSSGLTLEEKEEILHLLERVTVQQVSKITTKVILHNDTVGRRNIYFFNQMDGQDNQQTLSIYLRREFPTRLLNNCLHKAYSLLLHKWNIKGMMEFYDLFGCIGKPHLIHKTLNDLTVKDYSGQASFYRLYLCHVGSYLEARFVHLLDNEFCSFSTGEIVSLKKYLPREEEDMDECDIFLIVEVVRLVEKHASSHMFDTYEVNTSREQPCLVTARAFELYQFVRRERKELTLDQASDTKEEQLSKEEIYRKVRKQVKEIWGIDDEQQRRHLLRRLMFKWHPDKNPDREDLCTSLFQYIQSLIVRLERGEDVPDEEGVPDEDGSQARHIHQSKAYSSFFESFSRRRRRYQNFSSGWEGMSRDSPQQERLPRSDVWEAQRWQKQAHHDLKAAKEMTRLDEANMASWVVFMCYQAAEKMLLSTLYSQDMEEACRQKDSGSLTRTLTTLALRLNDQTNSQVKELVDSIQSIVCNSLEPQYPTFTHCPCDRYTLASARSMLEQTEKLFQVLGR